MAGQGAGWGRVEKHGAMGQDQWGGTFKASSQAHPCPFSQALVLFPSHSKSCPISLFHASGWELCLTWGSVSCVGERVWGLHTYTLGSQLPWSSKAWDFYHHIYFNLLVIKLHFVALICIFMTSNHFSKWLSFLQALAALLFCSLLIPQLTSFFWCFETGFGTRFLSFFWYILQYINRILLNT